MNDTMTLAERADALEHRMMRELDAIIVKSRLFKLADGDMSIPNGPAVAGGQSWQTHADGRRPAPAQDAR